MVVKNNKLLSRAGSRIGHLLILHHPRDKERCVIIKFKFTLILNLSLPHFSELQSKWSPLLFFTGPSRALESFHGLIIMMIRWNRIKNELPTPMRFRQMIVCNLLSAEEEQRQRVYGRQQKRNQK